MREAKRRSIKYQTGKNAVQMRVHRRSVEQKSKRDEIFCKGRSGLDESSLDPVVEEEVVQKPPSAQAKDTRQEKLQRWKEEKELKAKLKAQKMGKPFKVTKISHSQPIFLFSEKEVNGQPITTNAVNATNMSMRVTRSKMNVFVQAKVQPEKRAPPAKLIKISKSQPAPFGHTRKVTKTAKGTERLTAAKPQPCETITSSSTLPAAESVQVKSAPSFAPKQFAFTAPTELSPFFFQTSNTIEVEKLLPSLTMVPTVSPVKNISPSTNKEHDSSAFKTEHLFNTPQSAATKIKPVEISPLLENNPNICMTRGRPPSSKKFSPRSQISDANLPLTAIKCDIQPMESEDSTQCSANSSLMEAELMDTNASSTINESKESSPANYEPKVPSPSTDEPKVPSPSRQLRTRTPVNIAVSRNSSGLTLTPGYFRNLLEDQIRELKSLCSTWQAIMDTEQEYMSENVTGKIRTTIGQSELLMVERFKQFSGLIDDCEFGRGEKVTTCVDLQGFWEMIYFQVEDVKEKFERLENIKSIKWMDIPTPIKKPAKIVARAVRRGPMPSVRDYSATAAQSAARQRLAEAKAKAALLREAARKGSPKNQLFDGRECTDSLTRSLVASNEIALLGDKTEIPRRSLRKSLLAAKVWSTMDENKTTALLLPVPVLESLSLNSPVKNRSPTKRLSELFSPLSMGQKAKVQALETIYDGDESEMATHKPVDIPVCRAQKSTPQKRFTRSSNLIRFSDVLCTPADLTGLEKENAEFEPMAVHY